MAAMAEYATKQITRGVPLRAIARHMLGLYHGRTRGRLFRQTLSDSARLREDDVRLLQDALAVVEPALAEAGSN
jgi:tRNA-dihydrouridine synthase A